MVGLFCLKLIYAKLFLLQVLSTNSLITLLVWVILPSLAIAFTYGIEEYGFILDYLQTEKSKKELLE
jgi:hypothetical protein